jgi:prevent-host-death family protein
MEKVSPTPRTLSAAEARANFSEIVTEAAYAGRETVIERNNRPLAVIIGYEDYQALRAGRDEAEAREARFAVYDRIHERNRDVDPEVVEQVVAEAVQAARKPKA